MQKLDVNKLECIGKGSHGAVYLIDDSRCLKICKNIKQMQKEYSVLKKAKKYPQFPKVYECRSNYMVREYVKGVRADRFIDENGMDERLCQSITELLIIFKDLKFTRIDIKMNELYVCQDGSIKIIDTTRYMDKRASYPIKLFKALKESGWLNYYIDYLKKNYPDLYNEWSPQAEI